MTNKYDFEDSKQQKVMFFYQWKKYLIGIDQANDENPTSF